MVDGRDLLMGLSLGASVYPASRTRAGGPAPRGRRRAVPRQGQGRSRRAMFSPELLEVAAAKVRDRTGPAPRGRSRRVRAVFPARSRPRDRRGRPRRSACCAGACRTEAMPRRTTSCRSPRTAASSGDRRLGLSSVDRRTCGALAQRGMAHVSASPSTCRHCQLLDSRFVEHVRHIAAETSSSPPDASRSS